MCRLSTLLALLLLVPGLAGLVQQPLAADSDFHTYRLPAYPDHAVRIRRQDDSVCNAGSAQYTGWIDAGPRHLFFWYIESLHRPATDPLTLWMTGGPGCSGMIGMMLELGPCLVAANGSATHRNPFSWTANSSMVFIDQPAGTGLSYVDAGTELPGTSAAAAEDTLVFLRTLYTIFPALQAVPLHVAGESYSGHYVPAVAAALVRHNRQPETAPAARLPLTSILLGDGYVSPADTLAGFYPTLCTTTHSGLAAPVFNQSRCDAMATVLPRCLALHDACTAFPDPLVCHAAADYCEAHVADLFWRESHAGGRDPFDITRTCEVDLYCYRSVLDVERYMNTPAVWDALHVPAAVDRFRIMSPAVVRAFAAGSDGQQSAANDVALLLRYGVDVLLYNGNLDLACNTAGNLQWATRLRWTGQAAFGAATLEPWFLVDEDGATARKAGTWKAARGIGEARLAFVTVDQSGHMVPLDQPAAAQQIFTSWLFGLELSASPGHVNA